MQSRITEKGARIEISSLPRLRVIPYQMKQLFVNLISNSLKYSKEAQSPHIQISVNRDNDNIVRIAFSDNGIGFDQKYADRIFELFQRLHNKDRYSGTGIGLALCRKICENHGGSIAVTSKAGEGATFIISLPGA
jgi:light-regulated signal transduction histidine kinase (bacteriophytochrome)